MSWFKIKNFIRFYLLAFIASFIFLLFTFFAFWETYERVNERNETLFQIRSQTAKAAIEKRIQDYIQILKGAQGLYQVSDSVKRNEWKKYVESLEVELNYPGIQGIGYSIFLAHENLDDFEQRVQSTEFPEFKVWPEGKRPFYTAILYLEPQDFRNLRALGYDMYSDSVRREAMERARDTGRPALTGMVKLVQETDEKIQNGFLLYLPVYKKSDPEPVSLLKRRAALQGFVYSPFRANDLMDAILASRFSELDIEIYDGTTVTENNLLYDKDKVPSFSSKPKGLTKLSSVEIGGHTWQIFFAAFPDFGYETSFPWFILGGGILISGLVFMIMYSAANIQKSNYLNQLITDNASPALLIIDGDGYCTFMNPAAEVLTGYTFEEVQEQRLHNILHNKHPDGSFYMVDECPIVDAFRTGGSLFKHEDVFYKKNGERFYVSLNAQPIYENGKIVAHLMEVRDITQEKMAEGALREKNRNLETLNNIGKSLSAELELKKLLQLVTESCTELTQAEFGAFFYNQEKENGEPGILYAFSGVDMESYSDFSIPGKTVGIDLGLKDISAVRSEDITQDSRFVKDAPYNGMPVGHLPVKSFLSVPVISRSGAVIGGLVFGHSEAGKFTKNAEEVVKGVASQAAIAIDNSQLFETINNKNKELTRINSDLDHFVYTASHDLKAPVLNIEGLILALNKALKQGSQEKIDKIIEMIRISIIKFKETIDSLTEVSKINKNLDAELENLDLKEMLEDIQLSVQDMIHHSGVRIIENLECRELTFSKSNMRSLLLNLITNSIKYRSPVRRPEIKICCKKEEGRLILKVSDNGLGIPETQLSKIFVMFKRYHSHVEGTGVGLYLVKRIAENYGGSVEVESEVDKGTTFTIVLPEFN